MAVLPPMASASVRMATVENPGLRPSIRSPNIASCRSSLTSRASVLCRSTVNPSLAQARAPRCLVAELAERLRPCVRFGQAFLHQIVDAHVEVERELLVHVVANVVA